MALLTGFIAAAIAVARRKLIASDSSAAERALKSQARSRKAASEM